MEKSVLDITYSVRHHKKGLTTSDVKDIEGIVFVKLHAQNIDNHFFYKQLLLNEDDKIFEEQLNDINYRKTVKNYIMIVGKKLFHFC